MGIVRRIVRTTSNLMAQWHISRLSPQNLYARTYAAYPRASYRRNASAQQAALALQAAVERHIEQREHNYDLVVLGKDGATIRVRDRRGDERDLVDLVTNSYNDLEHVEENRQRLAEFVAREPLSACISRKICGLHRVHEELAAELAEFLGYEACVLGTCGYVSQLSTVFALLHEGDVIFSDEHSHSSLADGCRLSHAKVIVYRHCDYAHLEELLQEHRAEFNCAAIITDGVFSTKGAAVNVDRIVELAGRYNCLSIVDDTHGVLVCGEKGRGVLDLSTRKPDVLTGGFGKAFGAFGGFAVTSRALAETIGVLGRQNINTSFLSPLVAAQALINLRYYRAHHAELSGELNRKLRLFERELAERGLSCYPEAERYIHTIFCLYKKTERDTLRCQEELIEQGFLPSFFPPPVAPYPSLRFSLHRLVPEDRLVDLAGILGRMELFSDRGGLL